MCHFFFSMNSPIDTVACIKVEVSQCHDITWPSNLHKLEKVGEKKYNENRTKERRRVETIIMREEQAN